MTSALGPSAANPIFTSIHADGKHLQDELVELRRTLHRRPEIGLDLPQTQATVLDEIADLGLEVSVGSRLTSVTGLLRGGRPGPTVLLRADMDALPITEATGLPFASENTGVMHACGHDLHTAMLIGGMRLLAARQDQLAGNVIFMFQPGEEGDDGARLMIEEGVLDAAGERARAAYGMHVKSSAIPAGMISTRPGTFMASNDNLTLVVRGLGGHGAAPHFALDPVPAAAETITALQTMVTRRFNVFDPVVITVGVISAGTRPNIIPGEVRLEATVRSFSTGARARIEKEIVQLCTSVAAAHGVTAEITYGHGYPVTVNHEHEAALVASVAVDLLGPQRYTPMRNPQPGAEDFSRVLEAVPGSYMYLGAAVSENPAECHDNHSAFAIFNEDVLSVGASMHAAVAIGALDDLNS